MEDLINLIATNGSASEISNIVKNILYTKASEKIDYLKPYVADSMFNDEETEREL